MSAAPDPGHHDSAPAPAAATNAATASRLAAVLQSRIANGKVPSAGDVLQLAIMLHEARRHEEAEQWCRTGLRFAGEDWRLLNVLGVALKALGRLDEAEAELERGLRAAPSEAALLSNLGNVLLAQGKAERAGEVFSTLAGRNPGDPHARRMQGLAARRAGRLDEALAHAEAARALTPLDASAWIDLAALLEETGRRAEAFAVVDRAIALIGPARALVDTRIKLLRRDGRYEDAKDYIGERIAAEPRAAWLRGELARTHAHNDRPMASVHFAQALRLAPLDTDILCAAADNLDRTRGAAEQKAMAAAYQLAKQRLKLGGSLRKDAKILRGILNRSCDFAAAGSLGTFEELGHYFATTGQEAALHYMMAQVTTAAQRRLLVDLHRIALRPLEVVARQTPVTRPPPARRAKVRVGFMSSDLRNHPVAYFALPLLEGYDRDRVRGLLLFLLRGERTRCSGTSRRGWTPSAGGRASPTARRPAIAQDGLDILFELGGSTAMNKLDVDGVPAGAARRRAGSAIRIRPGSRRIDYILTDPYITPEDPRAADREAVRAAATPGSALGRLGFSPHSSIEDGLPEDRRGV